MKIVCMMSSLCLGGAERQLLALASTLHGAGHEVEVLTYHPDMFYGNLLEEYGLEHVFVEQTGSMWDLADRIAAHLREIGADCLIAFRPGTCLKACLVHRRCPEVRLFVSERNLNMAFLPHDLHRFRLFRKEAEKVICNNFAQEEFIRRHYPLLKDKLLTISNFVNLELFSPKTGETAVEGSPSPEAAGPQCGAAPVRILVTGRVTTRKNVRGLIRAAQMLMKENRRDGDRGRDFTVDWYGLARDNHYYRGCRRMIRRRGLDGIFKIHPATHDVLSQYHSCDIFCLPSYYEGTSNSIAEAMACGLPVVCSAVGDNKLYVREGVNGFLCNPHRPVTIAAALRKAMESDTGTLAAMGAESRRTAEEKLSLEQFTAKYKALLG